MRSPSSGVTIIGAGNWAWKGEEGRKDIKEGRKEGRISRKEGRKAGRKKERKDIKDGRTDRYQGRKEGYQGRNKGRQAQKKRRKEREGEGKRGQEKEREGKEREKEVAVTVRGITRIGSRFSQSVNVLNLYCCELNDRQIHVVVDLRIHKRRDRPQTYTTLGCSRSTKNINDVQRHK
jgi:hypothetical protein